jgi:hypothetical protein
MAFTMLKRHRRIAVLLALAAAIALTGLTLMALGGRGPTAAHAAVRHATKQAVTARDPDTLQFGDQTSPDPAGNAARTAATTDPAGNSQAGGPDPSSANDPAGNSQAGGPDTGATSGESSVDSEQGQPGEPAVGHADPAGAAGSDCTGNCVQ